VQIFERRTGVARVLFLRDVDSRQASAQDVRGLIGAQQVDPEHAPARPHPP